MAYYLFIDAEIGRFNLVGLTDDELHLVIEAYRNREHEFLFRDREFDFRKINDIRIFRNKTRKRFETFLKAAREAGRIIDTEMGELMIPDLLIEYGLDVTADFLGDIDDLHNYEVAESEHEDSGPLKGDLLSAAGAGIQRSLKLTEDAKVEEVVAAAPPPNSDWIDIYISHSRDEIPLVADVVTLIRSAFNLHADQIRTTSLQGFTFPRDMSNDKKIQIEMTKTKIWIGLTTPLSLLQGFVMYDGGARWGNGPLILLTFHTDEIDRRDGPISKSTFIDGTTMDGLNKFIAKIKSAIGVEPESVRVYERDMNNLLKLVNNTKVATRIEAEFS